MRTYYQILGVAERALPEEIRHAYRRLVRQCHPDVAGCEDGSSFREVRLAYETLSDARRRREYDERLAASRDVPAAVPSRRTEWFADEIAIDFPSVGDMLDRIRRGFLEPDRGRDHLSAEILLSPREASEGVEVPLAVPVPQTCPHCGGRGEVWMEPCGGCAGTGEARLRQWVRFPVPAGVAHGTRFRLSINGQSAPPVTVDVRIAVLR